MLLVNLTIIYLGGILILRHIQQHAYILSRIHFRYVLTGDLDGRLAQLLTDLSNTHPSQHGP